MLENGRMDRKEFELLNINIVIICEYYRLLTLINFASQKEEDELFKVYQYSIPIRNI